MATLYGLSSDFREHPVGEWTAVYNRHWGGLCLLDAEARRFLEQFSTPQVVHGDGPGKAGVFVVSDSPESRLLRQLALRRVLVAVDPSATGADALGAPQGEVLTATELPVTSLTQPPISAQRINVVQLVMINSCNFGCTYCFEGVQGADLKKQPDSIVKIRRPGNEPATEDETKINLLNSVYASEVRIQHQRDAENRLMRPEQAVDYISKAIAVAKKSGTTRLMIQFFGGEPLLNWRAIRAVLETFKHGEDHGIQIDYTTVTNGSLIRKEVAEAFRDYEVGVCVSFDSPESTSRPLKNGDDSRPIVLEGLRMLQEHGVRVAMNVALSTDTWETFGPPLIDFALEYGISEIGVVVDLDPNFYSRFGSTAITSKVWSVVQEGQDRGVVVTGYWHQIFQLLSNFGAITQRGFKNCSATGAQLSIEPNGSIFSCKAGSGRFGSIHDENILQSPTYREHAALRQNNPPFCRGCEIEGFCAGLCLGPREKAYGTIEKMEPAACGFYREITHKFIEAQAPYEIATFDLASARGAGATSEPGRA